jgi:hypothetical protein
MSEDHSQISPSRRDRAVRRVRNLTWAVAAGTAGLATSLSVVAANAFKGHARNTAPGAAAAAAPKHKHKRAPERRVVVPGPQHVPSISGAAPLQPPAEPPSTAPTPAPAPATPTPAPATPAPAPAPAPQPQTSGGS